MLCRHHVNLAGFRHRASHLDCRVHDVIPQHLRNVHERSDDPLVLARLLLVETCVLGRVLRDFEAVPRCTSRLAARHPEPFKNRFAVCFLENWIDLQCASWNIVKVPASQSLLISIPSTRDCSPMSVTLKRFCNFPFTIEMALDLLPARKRSST